MRKHYSKNKENTISPTRTKTSFLRKTTFSKQQKEKYTKNLKNTGKHTSSTYPSTETKQLLQNSHQKNPENNINMLTTKTPKPKQKNKRIIQKTLFSKTTKKQNSQASFKQKKIPPKKNTLFSKRLLTILVAILIGICLVRQLRVRQVVVGVRGCGKRRRCVAETVGRPFERKEDVVKSTEKGDL